jgi:hypothetical protein
LRQRRKEPHMWYVFGGLGVILYLVLIITLGVSTLRKGHLFMFILGIFMPLFWIIGAIMPARSAAA